MEVLHNINTACPSVSLGKEPKARGFTFLDSQTPVPANLSAVLSRERFLLFSLLITLNKNNQDFPTFVYFQLGISH